MLKAYFTFRIILEFIFKGNSFNVLFTWAFLLPPSFFEELLNTQSIVKNLICTL